MWLTGALGVMVVVIGGWLMMRQIDIPVTSYQSRESSLTDKQTTGEATVTGENTMAVNVSILITIDEREFEATLEDSRTTRALLEMLPLEIVMEDLHHNEKFFYLEERLPTDPVEVRQIESGDIMLFDDNCLVIFYNRHKTSYRYTRLGVIDDPRELQTAVGQGEVKVKFELKR